MKCPYCIQGRSRVVDTRDVGDGVRRRRECQACGQRFTTYERVASINLIVVKRDGRREDFDRDKLLTGLRTACHKRPIPTETLEHTATEIEAKLYRLGKAEIPSEVIGELVMERLRELDDVAYVRFASVYRHFHDVDTLAAEIEALKQRKQREEEMKRQLRLAI
ncbi:MAG: transcriptional repressor NrdR [Chloroflexi bacterium]|nr:MAG: transcriptional repressor NrdR [Chloroflexota bacterium]